MKKKLDERLRTYWQVWKYDVLGNRKDGYEVNDRHSIAREYLMLLKPTRHNECNYAVGTAYEFTRYYPTNRQIREALGLTGAKKGIELDGDDTSIYVSYDGKPYGELFCVSHRSLSGSCPEPDPYFQPTE